MGCGSGGSDLPWQRLSGLSRNGVPDMADDGECTFRFGRPLWLLCLLAIVIGGVVMNIFFFYLVTWRHLLAGASLGFFGYTLGGGAALLARMERSQVGQYLAFYFSYLVF